MTCTPTAHCILILFLSYLLHCSSAAHHHDKNHHPSALVVGAVHCDTCFLQQLSKSTHFISGASVTINCGGVFQREVLTNQRGAFGVRLPLAVIKTCSVKLIKSSDPSCSVASSAMANGFRLKAKRKHVHVYSAGLFTFKPLRQPDLCSQKVEQPALFPPIPTPTNPVQPPSFFPTNPFQPPSSSSGLPSSPAFPFPSFPFPANPMFPGFPVPPGFPSKGASP